LPCNRKPLKLSKIETPNSSNTLGYDAGGILNITNNGNVIIKKTMTSVNHWPRSSQDVYFYYFNAVVLDIIAPNIVFDQAGFSDALSNNDVGNQSVTRGQELCNWFSKYRK
jgi:hypothetical protein